MRGQLWDETVATCCETLLRGKAEADPEVLCLPSLDHPRLEFSGFVHDDGLVASPGKCNALGTLYPMAPCGL
ncbi:hypothetical protein JMJ94_19135 [Rhodovulum visakhapatnamense]|nr:hypothetical protein [Rhodovulum visakhapatnamense]